MTTKHSYCRNCGAHCGIVFEVENGAIASFKPDRQNPVSEGYVCIKGTMAVDLHRGDEPRLTHCLKRGEDGEYHPIDKYDAVREIAEKLRDILDRWGPRSLGAFFGTTSYMDCVGKPFFKSLMAAIGSPSVFSSMTLDQSSKWVTAARMGAWASGRPFYTQTDVILLAGINPLVSHSGYPVTPIPCGNTHHHFREAKRLGNKFIVIDSRYTETARFADIFIQPRPGFDAAIFSALIREVLANNWERRSFTDRYVVNLDVLESALEPFTIERVARAADVDPELLRSAAELLGKARKPGTGTGTGLNMAAFSNTAEHLAEVLTAIIGGYLVAGDEIPNDGIFVPRAETELVLPASRTWENEPKCASDKNFGKLMGEFPGSIFPHEILKGGEESLRAVFVTGSNPVATLGEPELTLEALKQLDLLVTFDPRQHSATASVSHYVIAPTLQFERAEVTTFTEWLFHRPFIQYGEQVMEPPPQVIGEQEFFWLLAKELGLQLELKNIPFGADFKDLPPGLLVNMDVMPSRDELIEWLVTATPFTLDEIRKHPHGLAPDRKIKRLKAPVEDDGVRLDVCPPDVRDEIDAVNKDLDAEPQRPFLLSVRRIVESYNSSFHGNAITKRRHGTNRLYMHPADLASISASDDDGVRITSSAGSVIGYLKADPTMKPGVVSMTHCWGALTTSDKYGLRGAHTGTLVSMRDVQSINRMPTQSGIFVDIQPLGLSLEEARALDAAELATG